MIVSLIGSQLGPVLNSELLFIFKCYVLFLIDRIARIGRIAQ